MESEFIPAGRDPIGLSQAKAIRPTQLWSQNRNHAKWEALKLSPCLELECYEGKEKNDFFGMFGTFENVEENPFLCHPILLTLVLQHTEALT